MTQYVIRRLLMAVPSMLLVSLIIFSLVRLVDGRVSSDEAKASGEDA